MVIKTEDVFSPYNFEGTLESLAEKVNELIKQYGKDASLNYDRYYYYPYDKECTPSYELRIQREETDEEMNKRIAEEEKYRKEQEEKEKAEFKRLAEKYGAKT